MTQEEASGKLCREYSLVISLSVNVGPTHFISALLVGRYSPEEPMQEPFEDEILESFIGHATSALFGGKPHLRQLHLNSMQHQRDLEGVVAIVSK